MTNLPQSFKKELSELFSFTAPEIISRLDSEDGASKLLIKRIRVNNFQKFIINVLVH